MLRLFVDLLTANDKYSVLNRDSLTQPIQILASLKQKNFFSIFSAFLISTLNFEHFQKKYNPQRRSISENRDSPKSDYINV